jgi:hypothetical protein
MLMISSCQRSVPDWARAPAERHRGEPTIAGDPLAIPKLATPPKLDGKLDDWQTGATLGPLVDPGGGADADDSPVAAFAKMGWDDRALYLGVVVRDKSPSSPFSRDDVDPHVWGKASGIEVMLQPGDPGDNRDYYELQVDINGAVWDTRFDDYNQPVTGAGPDRRYGHQEWQSRVERAIFVQRGGFYSIELAIPWTAFGPARVAIPPHPGDVWRANIYSFRDGQRFALAWSPLRGQGNFHRSSRFGRLRFASN